MFGANSMEASRAHGIRLRLRRDEGAGRRLGVAGVPFVLLDERYAIPGAQSADAYAEAITQVTEER